MSGEIKQISMGALAGDYERCAHMLDDALQRITELEAVNKRLREMTSNPRYWEARYRDEAAANDKLHDLLADIQDGCVVDCEGVVYVMDEQKVGEAIEAYMALAALDVANKKAPDASAEG